MLLHQMVKVEKGLNNMDKTTYFKQNPIKTKPFMFKEELDAMSEFIC